MQSDKKIVWEQRHLQRNRPFLQPLAVGAVCAVFIGIILTMGIQDLNRIDRTLVSFMENRGLEIIEVIQKLVQENLNYLAQARQASGSESFVPLKEEVSAAQKSLTKAMVDLAQEIDTRWKARGLNSAYLKTYAAEKGLWLVAVLNDKGKAVYYSRRLPPDLFLGTDFTPPRGGEITLDAVAHLGRMKKIGFIALRRTDGSGTVIIAMDRDGLRYWGTKVSVEKVIADLGGGQGLQYVTITDRMEKVLGSAGKVPAQVQTGNLHAREILAGVRKVESRKLAEGGNRILEIAAPFFLNEQIYGIARVGLELNSTEAILEENRRNTYLFMGIVVLITLLSMMLLYYDQNRHLAGIVRMERQLEKAERLSALGQLAAGVAHEIRNPLNAISMASQRLKREFSPTEQDKVADFQRLTGVIRDEIRRLNGIIEEFLTFSKSRRLEFRDYPVTEVLQKIVNLLQEEATVKGIVFRTSWKEAHVIPMDADKLQQALLNIVKNAMESITGKGTIDIAVEAKRAKTVRIAVSDTGCGMTAEELDRIFSPEYTTKEKGLGLGLSLAHEIVRGHGGEIRVISKAGEGTTFEIFLPAERGAEKAAGAGPDRRPTGNGA
ncbi:MAG: Sensor protein ZraS [Syntrophaceae bacterium PtaU1.Bin231]|nr:MAG: Sensor protein ZraS [Syntrophaceae bacterium PtaU1.Bin231]HOG17969.1 ATP-binding protein [Syntrophales bacterium]